MYTNRKKSRVLAVLLAALMLVMAFPLASLSTLAAYDSDQMAYVVEGNGPIEDLFWYDGYYGSYAHASKAWQLEKTGSSSYRYSDPILIPEAYTTITWSEFTLKGISKDAFALVSCKWDPTAGENGEGDWVIDPNGTNILGNSLASVGIQSYDATTKIMTYTYTTTKPNECIRLGIYGQYRANNEVDENGDPKATGFLPINADGYEWETYNQYFPVTVSKAEFVDGKVQGLIWQDGYVASATHKSGATDASKEYLSNVLYPSGADSVYSYATIVIPKAGTTVSYTDSDGSYASASTYVFSTWRAAATGGLELIYGLAGGASADNAYTTIDATTGARTYTYTSTYDNEIVRLSVRDDGVDPTGVTYVENSGGVKILERAGYDPDNRGAIELPAWSAGYYGASALTSGGAQYSYSTPITIFGAGKTLTFYDRKGLTDQASGSWDTASSGAYIVTHMSGYGSTTMVTGGVTNFNGGLALDANGNGYQDVTMNGVQYRKYTYKTTASEEYVALSYCSYLCGGVYPIVYVETPGAIGYDESLEGLTVVAIGDSYFDVSTLKGSTSEGKPANDMNDTWINLLASKYGIQHINRGIGGCTVSNVGSNPMVNRYQTQLPGFASTKNPAFDGASVDIVFFEGGRNDYNANVVIGDVNSYDPSTLCGAINIMLDDFLATYPNAVVICVTAWSHEGDNGYNKDKGYGECDDYAKAFEAVVNARRSSRVKVIDAYNRENYPALVTNTTFTALYNMKQGDQSHLNAAGMEFILPYFEATISEYYSDFLDSKVDGGETGVVFQNATGAVLSSANTAAAGSMVIPKYMPVSTVGQVIGWKGTLNGQPSFIPATGTLSFNVGDEAVYTEVLTMSITSTGEPSVRFTTGSTGMRFTTNVPLADWAAVEALVESLERGTLIVPEVYVDRVGGTLTHEALDAHNAQRIDVVATEWYTADETTGTFAGSISNIKAKNHTLRFTGVGYVKVTYTSGAEAYFYATDSASAIRAVYTIAYEAMSDRSDEQDEFYTNEIAPGSYSPYNNAQINVLKNFLKPVIALTGNATAEGAILTQSDIYTQEGLTLTVVFAGESGYDDGNGTSGNTSADAKWAEYAVALGDAANGATGVWVIASETGFDANQLCGVALDGAIQNHVYYAAEGVILVAFSTYSDFH